MVAALNECDRITPARGVGLTLPAARTYDVRFVLVASTRFIRRCQLTSSSPAGERSCVRGLGWPGAVAVGESRMVSDGGSDALCWRRVGETGDCAMAAGRLAVLLLDVSRLVEMEEAEACIILLCCELRRGMVEAAVAAAVLEEAGSTTGEDTADDCDIAGWQVKGGGRRGGEVCWQFDGHTWQGRGSSCNQG